jgi:hypothetical protein
VNKKKKYGQELNSVRVLGHRFRQIRVSTNILFVRIEQGYYTAIKPTWKVTTFLKNDNFLTMFRLLNRYKWKNFMYTTFGSVEKLTYLSKEGYNYLVMIKLPFYAVLSKREVS